MAGDIVVVLSDLHIGAGRLAEGNLLEDFSSDAAFAALLKDIAGESDLTGRPAQLILNGDLCEFPQVPSRDIFSPRQIYGPEDYRDMSQPASLQKLRLILAGHPDFFRALRAWLKSDEPRRTLVITKGNHDPQWQWPGVQDALRKALDAEGERAALLEFPAAGYARPGLYVEHGNQYAEAANRFANFAAPYAPGDPSQLETPWGSRFVIEFFNFVERDRYFVDGIKPYTALVWYALKYDPAFALRASVALLRAAPRMAGVRDQIMDSWLTNLQTHSEAAGRRYLDDPDYHREMNLVVAHALAEANPTGGEPAAETGDEELSELARQSMQAQEDSLAKAAERLAGEQQSSLVLFGHTHRPLDTRLPDGSRYINTGTWTWRIDLTSDQQARDLFAHPAQYTSSRWLSYARIDIDDTGRLSAQLLEYVPAEPSPVSAPPRQSGRLARLIALAKRLLRR